MKLGGKVKKKTNSLVISLGVKYFHQPSVVGNWVRIFGCFAAIKNLMIHESEKLQSWSCQELFKSLYSSQRLNLYDSAIIFYQVEGWQTSRSLANKRWVEKFKYQQ